MGEPSWRGAGAGTVGVSGVKHSAQASCAEQYSAQAAHFFIGPSCISQASCGAPIRHRPKHKHSYLGKVEKIVRGITVSCMGTSAL